MKKPELLLPAGSIETALAAFDGGADAVYCGLAKFNARERAVNFSFPQLRTLLERAKSEGKKVYITFNTLLKSSELSEAAQFLAELAKIVKAHNGLWNAEAEKYLLANAKPIS